MKASPATAHHVLSQEEQLAKLKDYSERCAKAYGLITEQRLLSVFGDVYAEIERVFEEFDTENDEHTLEEHISFVTDWVQVARFGSCPRNVSGIANLTGKEVIEEYIEQLDAVLSGQPFETQFCNFRLDADKKVIQSAKIASIISSFFAQIQVEVRDLEVRRSWLETNLPAFIKASNNDADWGSLAKQFGAGALAVASPFIGVPALIANWKSITDKGSSKTEQADLYIRQLTEFETETDLMRQQILDAAGQAKDYVTSKWKEVSGDAIFSVLAEISGRGISLEHYFAHIAEVKMAELLSAEEAISEWG